MTFNSSRALAEYGRQVPEDVEWIVVDNGSADDSAEQARSLGARVVALTENRGFGAANNLGLATARGTYVAFVNPDVEMDFGSLGRLADVIDEEYGLVAPQLLNHDGTLQANGRGFPALQNKVRNRIHEQGTSTYRLLARPGETRYVCWVMGAAVAARREWFISLGAWDERFFVYYEDADQGLRAWDSGMTVRLAGSVRWRHGWARETKSFRLKPWLLEMRAMRTFYSRYPAMLRSEASIRRRYEEIAGRLGTSSGTLGERQGAAP